MIRFLPLCVALGCTAPGVVCPHPHVGTDETIAVATATPDFATGTLTLVDIASGDVCDDLVTLTGDTVLTVAGDRLVALDRSGYDRFRSWVPGDWDRVDSEFSTGRGTNPHDVVRCGDRWVASLYGEPGATAIAVFDDEGRRVGSVDLSAFSDADGQPEVSDLVSDGQRVFAGAQRLDRDDGFEPAGPGALVEIDCDTLAVTDSWEIPENPRVVGDPASQLLIAGGDGELATWTASEGPQRLATTPAGMTVAALGAHGAGLVVTNDALWFSVSCVTADSGTLRPLVTTDAFVSDALVDHDGTGWIAVRGGWSPPDPPDGARIGPPAGLWRIDLDDCAIIDEIPTQLPPFDLATW